MTEGTRTELWAGWSLVLPEGTVAQRNPDKSWSAWDEMHVIDASIIETSGRRDGSALSPEEMISSAPGERVELDGAIAVISTDLEETDTSEGPQQIEWTRVNAGAPNTALVMSIGNRGPRDGAWHEAVWRSIGHTAKKGGLRGLFGRR